MTKSKRMLSLFFAVSLGLTPIVNCTFDSNKVYATKKMMNKMLFQVMQKN